MSQTLLDPPIIATLLKENPKPIFLLGAGASVTSGIPSAGEIVNLIVRWAYARQSGRDFDDPRITRSDWWPWLKQSQTWFKEDLPLADQFPYAVENLLRPQTSRRQFWGKLLNPGVGVSIGYLRLVELMHIGRISTVLTTNFDDCLSLARSQIRRPHIIEVVRTPSDYIKISATPPFPLAIHLHGDVSTYSDKNVVDEIQRMDERLVSSLVPILKDHPLIVVGYRGSEPSVMEHLLLSNAEKTDNYKSGIYWCLRRGDEPDNVPDFVKSLRQKLGANFAFVEIESFDNLFDRVIWTHLDEKKDPISFDRVVPILDTPEIELANFDLKSAKNYEQTDLDATLLRVRLTKYCERLRMWMPDKITDKWLIDQMLYLNLLRKDRTGTVSITNAGLLLFCKNPQQFISSANTIVRFSGPLVWLRQVFDDDGIVEDTVEKIIDGNLWVQLNDIMEALTLVNRPFRLKSETSVDVLPYDPIALKEVVVNSLVHRDYESCDSNIIEIRPDIITLSNPGGLVEEVLPSMEEEPIIEELRKGHRGRKGYRNTVLADLFYGAGAMDKRGSGLYDVLIRVQANGSNVDFGPNTDNTKFSVMIWSRPEAVDEITRTATPLVVVTTKFSSNIIAIEELPQEIYYAKSLYTTAKIIFQTYSDISFPPFDLNQGNVYSLTNLTKKHNVLRNVVNRETIDRMALDEFLHSQEGEKRFVRLLNDSFKSHLYATGLIVDMKKKRAYFSKSEEGERVMSYQARFKRARRTVARPRYNQAKDKIRYWEHKAFHFNVRRFGDQWGIMIEPTYVFTLDGKKILLASERVSALATRKMSRDYNSNVLNDIVFWMRCLAKDERDYFSLRTSNYGDLGDEIRLAATYVGATQNAVEFFEDEEDDADVVDEENDNDIDDELARLADEQRQE